MANVKFKIEGLKQLETALLELNKEYGGKSANQAMRPAIRKAMAPLKAQIEAKTPVDTGALKASVKLSIGVPTRKMVSQSEHYKSTTILAGRVGWHWKGKSLWKQALTVEYGNSKRSGQFILTNTFEQNNSQMLATFKATLGPAIEKKAKSLNKKRLKGK